MDFPKSLFLKWEFSEVLYKVWIFIPASFSFFVYYITSQSKRKSLYYIRLYNDKICQLALIFALRNGNISKIPIYYNSKIVTFDRIMEVLQMSIFELLCVFLPPNFILMTDYCWHCWVGGLGQHWQYFQS